MRQNAMRTYPILIVTENLNVGGAEKYTVLVANELHARGHRVVVLANQGPFRERFHPDIRFVRAFFEHGLFGVLYGAFQMVRVCLEERIVLIHAQKLESSRAAYLARFVTGVPIVKTAHGYTRKELLTLGSVINRYSDKVVTVVDWLVDELCANGVEKGKLSLIYNGMSPAGPSLSEEERAALRTRLGIRKGDPVLVSVSRLERGKNHAELIEWFPQVREAVPDAKLIIVGDGPEKGRLEEQARALALDASIAFVDATTVVDPYLQIADIFCTPSVGQGMAVLEAMAAGLPVIGTRPRGTPQVVLDGVTGFVVTKHDGPAFVSRIITLLQDAAMRQRFGRAGKELMTAQFFHGRMVDQLEEVYAECLAEHAKR
ncbi:MAG TPA: glycosyltransferase family 4 protein [Candidatus Paceibacterota bacterium]|nr:glycosyltransferase family 4 protein [Candidatus Paceibacterota bacterium]